MFHSLQLNVNLHYHQKHHLKGACQISKEVQNVMDNVVAESLVEKYTNRIINLFLWVFDNQELRTLLFKPWFIFDLENSH